MSNKGNQIELEYGDPAIVVVIDGDEIAYKCAAENEERGVKVTNTSNEASANFKNKTEFKKLVHSLEVPDDLFTIEDTQVGGSKINAQGTLKRMITNLCKAVDAGAYEIYIGGKDNFRDSLPLPRKYKGDREGTVRPILLKDMKDYLVRFHKAVEIEGREADDQLTTRMYDGYKSNKKIVAATQDKDAKQTSGWLYDPNSKKIQFIDGFGELEIVELSKKTVKGAGRKFLYFQMVFGDSADCYDPRDLAKTVTGKKPSFGEITAYNLMKDLNTDKECLEAVTGLYKGWFGEDKFSYTDWKETEHTITWVDALQLYTDCAFMQRWEGDRLDIRKLLDKLGIDYE